MKPPLVEVDAGWDYKVLIVDDAWVMRWPRHRLAVEEIEQEVELLPVLAPLLPVEVPQFEYVCREPWLVAYRFIRGDALLAEDPDGVRTFLDALHAVDVGAVPARRPDWLEEYREQAEEFRRVVLPLLDPDERPRGEALLAEVETLTDFRFSGPMMTRWLVPIDDTNCMNIGFLYVPNDWEVDDELRRRARIYHRLGPWFEVHYGDFTDQPEWVRSGLAGVRARL